MRCTGTRVDLLYAPTCTALGKNQVKPRPMGGGKTQEEEEKPDGRRRQAHHHRQHHRQHHHQHQHHCHLPQKEEGGPLPPLPSCPPCPTAPGHGSSGAWSRRSMARTLPPRRPCPHKDRRPPQLDVGCLLAYPLPWPCRCLLGLGQEGPKTGRLPRALSSAATHTLIGASPSRVWRAAPPTPPRVPARE